MIYKKQNAPRRKWLYLAVVAVLIVLGLGSFLLFTTVHNHNRTPASVTGPETKGEATSDSVTPAGTTDSSGTDTTNDSQDKGNSSGGSASTAPVTPTGNFVSNHHPNLSGTPAPNQMASNCTTTPGASCQISFTQNGITKSLDPKTTDSQGSAYWNWKLQTVGLTQGTWIVKATATLNGSSSTATDAQGLVVAP